MIPSYTLEKHLYFDVETAGITPDLQTLQQTNPRLAKLWERRVKYYRSYPEYAHATSDAIFLDKAGLEPEFARVVCVSFGQIDSDGKSRFVSFSGEEEAEILAKSKKVIINAQGKNMKLAGHNIKGFDVPCLCKRMIFNGIKPPVLLQVWDKKPWEIPFLDTSEVFAFGSWTQQKYLSLDLLACSLDVVSPKEDIDGSQVHRVFWEEKDHAKISQYCEKDVETVINVLQKVARLE
jgi:hypothetical protein